MKMTKFLKATYGLSSICLLSAVTVHACLSEMPEMPDVVKHEPADGPVVIRNVFPEHGLTDPHVMIVGDRLYLGCGHDQSWDVDRDWTMDRWEIWSTDDLKTWTQECNIEPEDTYFGPAANCWAGDFAQKDGKFYWYFSNRNIDTGVMVADKPGGPYRDALGKPLIPERMKPTNSYDPDVYEEDGVFYIIFGAGTYYIGTLGDDMVSLADDPKMIEVKTADGEFMYTGDKPTVFKRDGLYYLFWGGKYAMSDKLYGPYEFKGQFTGGGHGDVFQWKGQWYTVREHHDTSMFYRGIMLKPIAFHADGTVDLSNDQNPRQNGGRSWEFDKTRMGWRAIYGTDLKWTPEGTIKGSLNHVEGIIESAPWCVSWLNNKMKLRIRMKNESSATKAVVYFAEFVSRPMAWKYPETDWTREASVTIDLKPNDTEFTEYVVDLSMVENLPQNLKRMRIRPADGVREGEWEIDYIRIGH